MKIYDIASVDAPKAGVKMIRDILRRMSWFTGNLTWRRALNLSLLLSSYVTRSPRSFGVPAVLKVDIAPACNLACTGCVHRAAEGNALLEAQDFKSSYRMSPDQFRSLLDEVGHRSSAVSLYMLGDPLMHPKLAEIASISRDFGLSVHVSTNFSFRLKDEKLRALVESGITDFTVCLDGFTQPTYERTRIKGNIDFVKRNLERLCALKRELGAEHFKIEVQYIKYQHNLHELEAAKRFLEPLGIDQFTVFWGDVQNYVDLDMSTFEILNSRPPSILPKCFWPYFHMAIRYDGEVVACSNYRHAMLNASGDPSRFLGNVLQDGVAKVWNGPAYRFARQSVVRPTEDDEGHFCYGCPVLYETTVNRNVKKADAFHLNGEPVSAPA